MKPVNKTTVSAANSVILYSLPKQHKPLKSNYINYYYTNKGIMRHFLYISPFFPPICRVGAFRPLKFSRHIAQFGWEPIVLCDSWKTANTDDSLLETLPAPIKVIRKYSARTSDSLAAGSSTQQTIKTNNKKRNNFLSGREWLPLGDAAFHISHALNAARKTLEQYKCDAIVINADPVAALVVGQILSKETGIPLIIDLRDPWGPCKLRQPLRPFYTRWIERYVETKIIKQASKVILNTDTARHHYIKSNPSEPKNKFIVIRNHGDKELIRSGSSPVPNFATFTLLFLGSFSRFVKASSLLNLLAHLKKNGLKKIDFQLALTSKLNIEDEELAIKLDIIEYINIIPSVSYRDVGKLIDNADMLTLILPTEQRIQAKFYDYLFSDRPILAISEFHPELDEILSETHSGKLFHPNKINQMSSFIYSFLHHRGKPVLKRHDIYTEKYTSKKASKKLADTLDSITNSPRKKINDNA